MTPEQKNRIMERVGALVKAEAIRRCPVDLGQLRLSIDFRIEGDYIVIFSNLKYAEFVEWGAGKFHIDENGNPDPHEGWDVVPVNAKALRFEVGRKERLAAHAGKNTANIVFAKKVHIEGIQAQPFVRPALFSSIPQIKAIIEEELQA